MRKWYESWELCLSALQHMHNCSNLCCCSQVQRRQVFHYFQRALNSGGAASSSALLQWKIKPASKQHVIICICHFVTFHIILWQFLSLFKSMCLMVGNVRGTKSAGQSQPDFLCCKGLKTSIWGKGSICTHFSLKGAGPKLGQDGGMMTASKIWPTTMTPHISGCQQVQGLNICTVFVHRWPFLLHVWSKSIFFNKLESYMYIFIYTYVHTYWYII